LLAKCHENSDRFSKAVGAAPASLPPFQLEVDRIAWESPANRTPARPQTAATTVATQKFIRQALADGVIVPTQAPYKKDGTFRLCLDYRNLNSCTFAKHRNNAATNW